MSVKILANASPFLAAQPWAKELDEPEGFLRHRAEVEAYCQRILSDAEAHVWTVANRSARVRQFYQQKPEALVKEWQAQQQMLERLREVEGIVLYLRDRYDTSPQGEVSALSEAVESAARMGDLRLRAIQQMSEAQREQAETVLAVRMYRPTIWEWLTSPFRPRTRAKELDSLQADTSIPNAFQELLQQAARWQENPTLQAYAEKQEQRAMEARRLSGRLEAGVRAFQRGEASAADIDALARQMRELYHLQGETDKMPAPVAEDNGLRARLGRWWQRVTGQAPAEPPALVTRQRSTMQLWEAVSREQAVGDKPEQVLQEMEHLAAGSARLLAMREELMAWRAALPPLAPLSQQEGEELYRRAADWLQYQELPASLEGFGKEPFAHVTAELRNMPGMRRRGVARLQTDGDMVLYAHQDGTLGLLQTLLHELGHVELYATARAAHGAKHGAVPMHAGIEGNASSAIHETKAALNEMLFYSLMQQIRPNDPVLQQHLEVHRLLLATDATQSVERLRAEVAVRQVLEHLGDASVSPAQLHQHMKQAVEQAAPAYVEYRRRTSKDDAARQHWEQYPHLMISDDMMHERAFRGASYALAANAVFPLYMQPDGVLATPELWRTVHHAMMQALRADVQAGQSKALTVQAVEQHIDKSLGVQRNHVLEQVLEHMGQRMQQLRSQITPEETEVAQPSASDTLQPDVDAPLVGAAVAGMHANHAGKER